MKPPSLLRVPVSLLPIVMAAGLAHAQSTLTPGKAIVSFSFARTPLGEFPAAFQLLSGNLEAVDKDGVRMLKASAVTEFLITLPEVLPQDFTLEFDFIPKGCCNPEDLAFEGTPKINQGPASARVAWHPKNLMVVGGGSMYQSGMPAELAATLPGTLTHVVLTAEGNTLRLYTNG